MCRSMHASYFTHAESRVVVFPAILHHLQFHLETRDDLLEKSLNIMSSIITVLRDQEVSSYIRC